jgi:hypothetical protein
MGRGLFLAQLIEVVWNYLRSRYVDRATRRNVEAVFDKLAGPPCRKDKK